MLDSRNLQSTQKIKLHMCSSILQISLFLPLTQPVDTLKSRIQSRYYLSYTDALSKIRQNGFRSLYKGFSVMYLTLVLKQPPKLAIYEHIKNPTLAGFCAGVSGVIIGTPLSYIKTNLQVNNNFTIKTLFTKGIKGIYSSCVAWKYESTKEIVGNTAFYGLLKTFNNLLDNNTNKTKEKTFMTGFVAGFLGTYISHPIDTMKVFKQTYLQSGTFSQIFTEIYYSGKSIPSYTNFWRGVTAVATKHSLTGGFGMLTYEAIKTELYKRHLV